MVSSSDVRIQPKRRRRRGRRREEGGGVCEEPHICELAWAKRTDFSESFQCRGYKVVTQ